MENALENYFVSRKIEYFSVLDYAFCREINPRLSARVGFTPKSAIVYLIPYYTGECDNISRYAASLDYHLVIAEINKGLIEFLDERFPGYNAKSYGDHSPIDERGAALSAGLGILGDNGLIINEKYGSYVFIADVLTDIPPDLLSARAPRAVVHCESCGACKRACPTGILSGQGADCLSAITQKKGTHTEEEIALMRAHNAVWGCDLCQSSCPHNRHPVRTPVAFFYEGRIEKLTSDLLDAMSDPEFSRRAFSWRGRGVVERNLTYFEDMEGKE